MPRNSWSFQKQVVIPPAVREGFASRSASRSACAARSGRLHRMALNFGDPS